MTAYRDAFGAELAPGDKALVWTYYGFKRYYVHSFGEARVYFSSLPPNAYKGLTTIRKEYYAVVDTGWFGGGRATRVVKE